MSEPWEDFKEEEPWRDFPSEREETAPAQAPKSSLALRGLKHIGGTGEAAVGTLLDIGVMSGSGVAGIAGVIAGMWPGGESPSEKAAKWQKSTSGLSEYTPPYSEVGKQAQEGIGTVMELGVKGAKFSGSGYAGLAAAPGGVEEMARAQQEFRDEPFGEGVYRHTQSPFLATVTTILPELAAMGIVKPKPGSTVKIKDVAREYDPRRMDIPEGYGGVTTKAAQQKWTRADEASVAKSEFDKLQQAIKAKDVQRVSEIIDANPAIISAFDELGIRYSPQMVSENAAVRATASGMKSAPESGLMHLDEVVGKQLKSAGDELVNRYGTTDRALLDESVRMKFDADIRMLEKQANDTFKIINEQIPKGERINVSRSREYIEQRINDLGAGNIAEGLERASRHEKQLWNLTHRREAGKTEWKSNDPSYAAIDAYRKDVGQGLNKEGIFKDGDIGELKNTYGLVAEAQQQAATNFGSGIAYREANRLVEIRKGIEESATTVMGRNLERGLVTSVDSAAGGLIKGNTAPFKKLIDNVPEAQRPAIAAAVIDKIFAGGGRATGLGSGFLKASESLSPTSRKLLFSYLPKEAQRRFNVIETASNGFYRSLLKDNTSNTALGNNVVRSIEDGSLWAKIFGDGGNVPFAGDWISKLKPKPEAKRVRSADEFITSETLRQGVREYARGQQSHAEALITASKQYRDWYNTLDQATKRAVDEIGVTAFLFASQMEESE